MMEEIDTSNGVLFPFYDADTNMVYLCGKVCIMSKDSFHLKAEINLVKSQGFFSAKENTVYIL